MALGCAAMASRCKGIHCFVMYISNMTNHHYIRSMTWVDIYDTFILPALTRLGSATTTPADNAGTYFVSTSTTETDESFLTKNNYEYLSLHQFNYLIKQLPN